MAPGSPHWCQQGQGKWGPSGHLLPTTQLGSAVHPEPTSSLTAAPASILTSPGPSTSHGRYLGLPSQSCCPSHLY